jgi:hypothetical protein
MKKPEWEPEKTGLTAEDDDRRKGKKETQHKSTKRTIRIAESREQPILGFLLSCLSASGTKRCLPLPNFIPEGFNTEGEHKMSRSEGRIRKNKKIH